MSEKVRYIEEILNKIDDIYIKCQIIIQPFAAVTIDICINSNKKISCHQLPAGVRRSTW